MDQNTTPKRRKRSLDNTLHDVSQAQTPSSIKRQRLDQTAAASSSTPRALSAIASAISGIFGHGRQSNTQDNTPSAPAPAPAPAAPSPAAPAPAASVPTAAPKLPISASTNGLLNRPANNGLPPIKSRPSIKLAALKGTIWDNGDLPPTKTSTVPKNRPGRPPSKPTAAKAKAKAVKQVKQVKESEAIASSSKNGTAPSAPKGILTPRKKRGRPRKNVTFHQGLDGEVFFEDLPKIPSAKKRAAKTPRLTKAQKEQEKYDEIVCEICSKPDSEAPNEIILCDNCDFAVHQRCYDIAEIPEGDWLCKSCSQEDVLATPSKLLQPGAKTVEAARAVEAAPEIPNLDLHLRALQRVLLDRCSGRRRIRIYGQEESYEKARQLVEQTVLAGEGNSMLIIGPRGCGKTIVSTVRGQLYLSHFISFSLRLDPVSFNAEDFLLTKNWFHAQLVEEVILDLSREHRHDFHVVHLNGFVHTDDKLALKEIWRQLGKEMEVEDDLLHRVRTAVVYSNAILIVTKGFVADSQDLLDQLRGHNGLITRPSIPSIRNHGHRRRHHVPVSRVHH